MKNAFISMWKNVFNYTGTVGRKEFWLACIAEVIFMYLLLIPEAIILIPLQLIGIPIMISTALFCTLHIGFCILPLISLYVRRANDVGLKKAGKIYVALVIPIVGAMIMSLFPSDSVEGNFPWYVHLFIIGIGLGIYASIFFAFAPLLSEILMGIGLVLGAISLITMAVLMR